MKFGKNTIKIMAISAVLCFLLLMVAEAGVAILMNPDHGLPGVGYVTGIVDSVHIDQNTGYADSFVVCGISLSIVDPEQQNSYFTAKLLEWKERAGGDPSSNWKVQCTFVVYPGCPLISCVFFYGYVPPLWWRPVHVERCVVP